MVGRGLTLKRPEQRRPWLELAQILCVGWIARAAFIVAVPPRAHSVDVNGWMLVAQKLREGANPYVATTRLNWPPAWMIVVSLLDHAAHGFGISFLLALRIFLIGVESVLVVALYSFLAGVVPAEARRVVLVGISLNPVAILLICQHGNFDVLVGLCVFIGAILLARHSGSRDVVVWLAATLAFGLGALIKTVPLILAPLLVRGAALARPLARPIAAVLFAGPIMLGISVLFVLAPHDVLQKVLLYRSESGYFGVTGVLDAVHAGGLTTIYGKVFFVLLAMWFACASARLWRVDLDGRRIILLAGLVLLAVPTLGPGYALQYAYWWLPLLVATYPLFDREWRRLLLGFYAIGAVTYVVLYAFVPSLGAFVAALLPQSSLARQAGWKLSELHWLTIIQIPLFVRALFVLWAGTKWLVAGEGGRRGAEAADPHSRTATVATATSGLSHPPL